MVQDQADKKTRKVEIDENSMVSRSYDQGGKEYAGGY